LAALIEVSATLATPLDDEKWMAMAIAEAREAVVHDDVPVGAVVVSADGVVAAGHNRREVDRDPTAHAEVGALRSLAARVGGWNLDGSTLYVTQEPCPMCAGAIVNARVSRLVYGCDNRKAGAVRTHYQLVEDPRLNHRVSVTRGVLAVECGALLTAFFKKLRES
jgi:tRNA(adenine34) deaminase